MHHRVICLHRRRLHLRLPVEPTAKGKKIKGKESAVSMSQQAKGQEKEIQVEGEGKVLRLILCGDGKIHRLVHGLVHGMYVDYVQVCMCVCSTCTVLL